MQFDGHIVDKMGKMGKMDKMGKMGKMAKTIMPTDTHIYIQYS